MKVQEQTIHDINIDQFKYQKRKETSHFHRVDVNELIKKINQNKRTNFYSTVRYAVVCFSILAFLSLVIVKF